MVPDCTGTAQAGGRSIHADKLTILEALEASGARKRRFKSAALLRIPMDQLGDDTSVPTTVRIVLEQLHLRL
ncbi:hypothetical protein CGCS363_v012397 [Colletotrichum siamense]|uniref:uncharacterized protein n=1 Tax=Colletotrichum siamense TaxID=690259 RepID=UPI0018728B0B|nr:uncharacterized protein CGCS363_v012397 [Colletotrichum siamense]KAF5490029.1 hypothetical protein CGCS363_v012397 [Colletotrichum siamense]